MIKTFSLFIALLISAGSFSQTTNTNQSSKKKSLTTGFYGKRFMLQLGAGAHHNTLLKIASSTERNLRNSTYYRKYKDQINSDQFNYSFYGNMGVVLKERLALSVDFNYYSGNIFLQSIGRRNYTDEFGNYYVTPGYDARVKYTTMRIMPRIEIGSGGSNMPVGLVNVLGIGIELSKFKSGNYKSISAYEDYSYYPDSVQISNRNLTFKDETTFNLTLMYGLEYRLPISRNIAWNFGGYVHLNIPIQEIISDELLGVNYGGFSIYGDNDEEYKLQLSRYRFQNLFSLRTGIVIML